MGLGTIINVACIVAGGIVGLVGSIPVFCVGVNPVRPRAFKPASMLPSALAAAHAAYLP